MSESNGREAAGAAQRDQHRGAGAPRRSVIGGSIADQRLLDSHQRSDWKTRDAWRALRILSEFVEGFDTLSDLQPAVSVFGSARSLPDSPECRLAEAVKGRVNRVRRRTAAPPSSTDTPHPASGS